MAKRTKNDPADFETVISDKFRTTPIKETIRKVSELPASAILYKCAASSYWQFRVYLEGKQRKRSTKEEELTKAERAAKLIYAEMLQSVHSGQIKAKPSSTKTLQLIADTLWSRNETRTKNGELNKQKVRNDRYVYERHIKPFFANTDVKKIDADLLEDFKTYLANKDLQPTTQVSYINIVMALLKQAQIKNFIAYVPVKPKVRVSAQQDRLDHGRCGEPQQSRASGQGSSLVDGWRKRFCPVRFALRSCAARSETGYVGG